MHRITTLITLTVLFSTLALAASKPTQLERKYGVNLVEVQREAEVDWVRDKVKIIFDFQDHSNKYVRMQSDRELKHMLRHSQTRERVGIDEANLTPYLRNVKIKMGLLQNKTGGELNDSRNNATSQKNASEKVATRKKPIQEKPFRLDQLVECVKSRPLIHGPFARFHHWIGSLSETTLEKVVVMSESIRGSC